VFFKKKLKYFLIVAKPHEYWLLEVRKTDLKQNLGTFFKKFLTHS